MSQQPPSLRDLEEAVSKINALIDSTDALTSAVTKIAQRRKWDVGIAALMIVLLLGMSGVALFLSSRIDSTRDSIRASCVATNDSKTVLRDVFALAQAAAPVPTLAPGATAQERATFDKAQREAKARTEAFYESFNRRTALRAC